MFVLVPLIFQASSINVMLGLLVFRIGIHAKALFCITFGEETIGTVIQNLLNSNNGRRAWRLDIELFYVFKKSFRFYNKGNKKKEVLNEVHNGDPRNDTKTI